MKFVVVFVFNDTTMPTSLPSPPPRAANNICRVLIELPLLCVCVYCPLMETLPILGAHALLRLIEKGVEWTDPLSLRLNSRSDHGNISDDDYAQNATPIVH
jgi:hypothetical protein